MGGWVNGRTDGQKDRQTDTNKRRYCQSIVVLTHFYMQGLHEFPQHAVKANSLQR